MRELIARSTRLVVMTGRAQRMLQAALRLSGREIAGADALHELQVYSQPYPEDRLPLRHRIMLNLLRGRVTRIPTRIINSGWLKLRANRRRPS